MLETIIPVGVTIGSLILYAYWFRCACLLILVAKSPRDYAKGVEIANQLTFSDVQSALNNSAADLTKLKESLDRDFRVLSRLLQYGTGSPAPQEAIERRMLRANYWAVGAWCWVSMRISPRASRRALQEMAVILAHFASTLGEQLARVNL
jgi:hypothetical protein